MSVEEQDILRSAIIEFAEKNIANSAVAIERTGITGDLAVSLAAQGFLGAALPPEAGGAGIDRQGYAVILKELAAYSPSVSALVLITGSVAGKILTKKDDSLLGKIATGEEAFAVSLWPATDGSGNAGELKISGKKITGIRRYVIGRPGGCLAAVTDEGKLVLVKSGFTLSDEDHHLSFRGLSYSVASVDSEDFEVISSNGTETMEKILSGMDLEIAAIALGIARGALTKTVDYTKVRKTFEKPLKDYSPVANNISRLMSELRVAEIALQASGEMNETEVLMLKMHSTDLAKRATKYSLQYHGGYGYIEDFGVEKFYRDAVGLTILLENQAADGMRLSKEVFGEKSGYL
ncbi:MAG: acyl-CoA dehydrogenase family protein [Thermoplasmataceae archaeon]